MGGFLFGRNIITRMESGRLRFEIFAFNSFCGDVWGYVFDRVYGTVAHLNQ
jgi:hypothetical protein